MALHIEPLPSRLLHWFYYNDIGNLVMVRSYFHFSYHAMLADFANDPDLRVSDLDKVLRTRKRKFRIVAGTAT